MPLPVELTLVLAATRNMGIGRAGTLPWTGLKKEMAYFARPPSALNAVIMGRKTWDSIPPKFRPLKGRLNIVISRSHPDVAPEQMEVDVQTEPVKVSSLQKALEYLRGSSAAKEGKVYVIGGAQIYGAALELKEKETKRILLTRVMSDFECDTFFPLELSEGQAGGRWVKKSKAALDAWTGETVPEGVQEENGTRYEFQMWERVD
ncbi:dihydrofolate reductase [Pseudomassariella vexata]|uniref:Dihydrofolate reductase n=1 Tax=Pseudomassariella vexata TaxID=1141098 RepID=A0A1Y2EDQ1_9PEZI|nr:dihydrofolate reductase [Pseudomassariella vexata]ORY69701.1 dihydrofolate reductase [Pseudomassariella vexata]